LLKDLSGGSYSGKRRKQVQDRMGFICSVTACMKKTLNPYVGMTGQGLLLAVEQEFFNWPPEKQLLHLDELLADYLAAPGNCRSTRDLAPVPLLGVPGWAAENEDAAYYDNTAYFRPGRRG